MTAWVTQIGVWALQRASALPDTIVTKQVAQPRDWFNLASGVASIVISLALVALALGLLPAAWNFRKSYAKVNDLLDRIWGDVHPIVRNASVVADNANYITTAIRTDLQKIQETLALANDRLLRAVDDTERRLNEFHALLGVVQQEAEGTFVSTAAALRGLREGAATFREDALAFRDALGAREDEPGLDEAFDDDLPDDDLTTDIPGPPGERGRAPREDRSDDFSPPAFPRAASRRVAEQPRIRQRPEEPGRAG